LFLGGGKDTIISTHYYGKSYEDKENAETSGTGKLLVRLLD
jgi:hypothetical protein